VTAERTQSFSSTQARWMFLALANCDPECGLPGMCQGSLDVYYTLEFTNGEAWSVKHYSADEIGVAETEIFFFVFQVGGVRGVTPRTPHAPTSHYPNPPEMCLVGAAGGDDGGRAGGAPPAVHAEQVPPDGATAQRVHWPHTSG
jgi:hypothetical protein